MVAPNIFTTYNVAKFCNVHHTTVIHWVNEGKLEAYTTPGGHRRIKKDILIEFMEKYGMPVSEELKSKKKRLLLVDDDEDALQEYKEALSGNGFIFDFATNGFEAGTKIYKSRPDIILLDFKMPGMDGFQVCEILHKDPQTAHIPIIAVTVLKSNEDVQRIKEYGVREYLPKPVDIEKLKKMIIRILGIEKEEVK